MKKSNLSLCSNIRCRTSQVLTIVAMMLLLATGAVSASNKDTGRYTLKVTNSNLKTVLKALSVNTPYVFVYNDDLILGRNAGALNFNSSTIEEIMENCLADTGLDYEIATGNIIIIKEQKEHPQLNESSTSVQQEKKVTITGRVTDTKGEPLPGVSILVQGTTNGTVTDIDGNYSFAGLKGTEVLVYSFIGMTNQVVNITNQSVINIVLKDNAEMLSEAVVVAYGTAKKSTLTGSVGVVDESRIQKAQVSNVTNALEGTSSGVQVITPSGQPGSGADIRIRGVGSITGSSTPLYVVDGVPFDGNLSSIEPSDIKSMSILKDAASASIYGSRAANGVVVITTYQGLKNSAPEVNVRSTAGVSSRAVTPVERVSTNTWMELMWEAFRNSNLDDGDDANIAAEKASRALISSIGINPYGESVTEPVGHDGKLKPGLKPLWNDNWDEAIIGKGERYQTSVNIKGGTDKTQYYFSLARLDEKGIMLGSAFERTSARLNLTNQTKKWLKLHMNVSYAYSEQDFNDSQDSNVGNGATYGLNMPGFYPIYKRDLNTGSYLLDDAGNKQYDWGTYRTSSFATGNLIDELNNYTIDKRKRDLVSLRGYAEVDFAKMSNSLSFLKGLTFKTSYNTDVNIGNSQSYSPSFTAVSSGENDVTQDLQNTSASRSTSVVRSYTFNNLLTYQKKIAEKHSLNALLGYELYEYQSSYNGGSKMNFPIPNVNEPTFGSQISNFDGYSDLYRLQSWLGRAEYSFNEKYNTSLSLRRDGSSRFHPDNQWGTFWSAGVAWNIHKESFFEVLANTVDFLKLRASRGSSGNQNIGTYYAYQDLYDAGRVGDAPSLALSRLGNKDLKWEANISSNIGIDYGLFNSRLRGSFEWFQRRSNDLIYSLPLPNSSGFASILANVGEMKNTGFEMDIKGVLINRDKIRWELGANATTFKNKISEFPLEEVISGTKRLKEGEDIYAFYIREWAGMSKVGQQLYDRIDGAIQPTAAVSRGGDPTWYLIDEATGEKYATSNYNEADRIDAGSALPDLYGGINTDITIHNFEISALMSYRIGGQLYTGGSYTSWFGTGSSNARPWAKDMVDRWTPDNQDSDLPRLQRNAPQNGWGSTSTRHLYDGSYARLKNLAITYHVPKKIISKLNISKLNVFIQGENLLTFYGVDGVDPELGGLNGVTGYNYPVAKVFSGGINLTF
ncbi:SusC/RagA family TonB-linked outer membrane protein [Carboxylicivirga taeanensis]|uniref:SusC/RagA family TonB-linked outer membrane protein n=1 Tax=Carboxylicivirga taeanensis TaxID=1416875 RepID=UPI003F6DC8FC